MTNEQIRPHQRELERYCQAHDFDLVEILQEVRVTVLPEIVNPDVKEEDKFEEACSLWLSFTPEANDQSTPRKRKATQKGKKSHG